MPEASTLADRLAQEARSHERYVRRMERLVGAGTVPKVDLERAYTAGYLLFYTSLERYIEQLFVGLLMGRLTVTRSGVRPIVAVSDEWVAFRLVLGDRKFADWLPFDYTRSRAKALFVGGQPFTSISNPDRNFLAEMSVLRNALTHRSPHSIAQFKEEFVMRGLPPAQRKPAGYLRGQHAVGQTRLSYHMAKGTAILRDLCL
jgi:hypothetical protein